MDDVERLRAAGATVEDGPTFNGVMWLRIVRPSGWVTYLGEADLIGLARLADALDAPT